MWDIICKNICGWSANDKKGFVHVVKRTGIGRCLVLGQRMGLSPMIHIYCEEYSWTFAGDNGASSQIIIFTHLNYVYAFKMNKSISVKQSTLRSC